MNEPRPRTLRGHEPGSPGAAPAGSATTGLSEQELGETGQRYGALFGQMLEGVAYCRLLFDHAGQAVDWVYLDVNPAFEALSGLHDVLGKRVSQLIPGIRETNPELFEIYGRVSRTGEPEEFETHVPALERWFRVRVYRPQEGHFAAMFENVTEARRAQEVLALSEGRLRGSLDTLDDPFVILAPIRSHDGAIAGFEVSFANHAAGAFLGSSPEALVGKPLPALLPSLRGGPPMGVFREVIESGMAWSEDSVGFTVLGPGGAEELRLYDVKVAPFGEGLFAIGHDVTERERLAQERDRLAAAIEQSIESVMITDEDASIVYVNLAFERTSGYRRDEVLGKNPRILKSGAHPPSFYEAMWAALKHGSPWVGDIVNRRKDGFFYTEDAVISPVRDPRGAIASYVAVKRDVTTERLLVQRSADLSRERALILETLRNLHAGGTPEATAQAICRQVARLTGIVAAEILAFETDGYAMSIGLAELGEPDPPLQRRSAHRSKQLWGRAADGPWVEPRTARQGHPEDQLATGMGAHSMAHAPVNYDGQLIGLLSVQASDAIEHAPIEEALPSIVEFAGLAGALLGPEIARRSEVSRNRATINAIIARRRFHPVFQPIVDMRTGAVVGYEALTRFDGFTDPWAVFAQADAAGLRHELETATIKAALMAARALPPLATLHLNVSPEFILSHRPLRSLVRQRRPRPVLEVTEHTAIVDYAAFREAFEALGPKVRLAVDDAGAGFASLRHILELRPAFVKLDRWLVSELEGDKARQAMIVGLLHFARATGCRLIAEGIETEAEAAVLRSIGLRFGQGFLFGEPCEAVVSDRPVPEANTSEP